MLITLTECGDGQCAPEEQQSGHCPIDCPVCGDGLCTSNETTSNCATDCWRSIPSPECGYVLPQSNIQPGLQVGSDTIGTLIENSMLWTIPGIEHMAHGVNVFNGEEAIAPLFMFTYCKGNSSRTLQDSYRGYVYQIPVQVSFNKSSISGNSR